MQKIAIYPGSFDPVTNGHVDIAQRGLKIFDKIIVAILHNPVKKFLFSVEERIEMLESSFEAYPNIEVETFDGLLVEYASKKGSIAILRGMRAVSDFEFEFQFHYVLLHNHETINIKASKMIKMLSYIKRQ